MTFLIRLSAKIYITSWPLRRGIFFDVMNIKLSTDKPEEQWPDQWRRLLEKWGEPVPKRALKNGKTSEELESWADNVSKSIPYALGKASGDGFWECQCCWRRQRETSLRSDAAALRKESGSCRFKPYPSPIRAMPSPITKGPQGETTQEKAEREVEQLFPTAASFRHGPMKILDLSPFSIDGVSGEEKEKEKEVSRVERLVDYTPPSSPLQNS